MKCRVQNTRILTPEELLTILCKSELLYSEYAETTLLFILGRKSQIHMIIMRSDFERIILCI